MQEIAKGRRLRYKIYTIVILLLWALIKIGQVPSILVSLIYSYLKFLKEFIKYIVPRVLKVLKYQYSRTTRSSITHYITNSFMRLLDLIKKLKSVLVNIGKIFFSLLANFLNFIFPKALRAAFIIIFLILFIFFYSYYLVLIAHELPNPKALKTSTSPLTSEIYDRNSKLLYRVFDDKNRYLVALSEIPQDLIQATIAIEDKNFYSHPGVDIYGITRALVTNLKTRQFQGGSTITQQLIKNTMLSPDKTVKRKLKEIILAFWAERIFSKDEILTMYFNEVSYGGNTIGVQAASISYFGKEVSKLNLAEIALLAGLPASPSIYSPYGLHPELSKQRQSQVLRRMVEDGYISKEQALTAMNKEINLKPIASNIQAPHFVMFVKSYLEQKYGPRFVSQGGLKIQTTLDLEIQHAVEKIIQEELISLTSLKVGNGAAMVVEAKTGHILAMQGSKDYNDKKSGNFNVTLSLRQPGSAIKPITYATAFKMGYSPGTTLLDSPTSFKNAWEVYSPVNYDGKFHGPVTIRTALASSYNVPAVKMLALVGIPAMLQTARDLGITTLNDTDRYGLSLTLGGGEVRMIDMMTSFSTFSQLGIKKDSSPILKVSDYMGNVLEDNTNPQGERALSPSVAYLITDILMDNKARIPAFGDNSLLKFPNHSIAVKTGTSDSKKDNWTFGYTPEVVVGVWVGNMDSSPMDARLTSGITGAAPIWQRIMKYLLEGKQDIVFKKPPEIIEGLVDGHKDLVISGTEARSSVVKREASPKPDGKSIITFQDPFSTYIEQ